MLRVGGSIHRARQRSHGGNSRSLVALVIGAERRRRERGCNRGFCGRESRAVENHLSDLWDSSSLSRVEIEDASENSVQFQRNRQNSPEEFGILHESTEGAVL